MAIAAAALCDPVGVTPRKWTRAEYRLLAEVGIIRPDERLELIHGEMIAKVSPQSRRHGLCVYRVARALERSFHEGFDVQQQLPIALSDCSEPEPEVLVVKGRAEDYVDDHPGPADAVLVVGISDTTLASDRETKSSLYAEAGLQDYWIVNLPGRCLEVHRQPARGADGRYLYTEKLTVLEAGAAAPLAAPGGSVRVTDLLPPPGKGRAGGE